LLQSVVTDAKIDGHILQRPGWAFNQPKLVDAGILPPGLLDVDSDYFPALSSQNAEAASKLHRIGGIFTPAAAYIQYTTISVQETVDAKKEENAAVHVGEAAELTLRIAEPLDCRDSLLRTEVRGLQW